MKKEFLFGTLVAALVGTSAHASFSATRECGVSKHIISWSDPTTSSSYAYYNTYQLNNSGSEDCRESHQASVGCTSAFTTLIDGKTHIVSQENANCGGSTTESSNPVWVPSGSCTRFSPLANSKQQESALDQVIYLGSRDLFENPEAGFDARVIVEHLDAVIAYHGYQFTALEREWVLVESIAGVAEWQLNRTRWTGKEPLTPYGRPKDLPPEWVPADKK